MGALKNPLDFLVKKFKNQNQTEQDMVIEKNLPEWAETHSAVRFFYIFSKFEHALKNNGYLKNETKAKPCWISFSKTMPNDFFEKSKNEYTKILFDDPPRQQIVRLGNLDFQENGQPINNTQQLFEAICIVRNNLFHGGKYSVPVADPSRNEPLLRACMHVLDGALDNNQKVATTFITPLEY